MTKLFVVFALVILTTMPARGQAPATTAPAADGQTRPVTWDDVAPVRAFLEAQGCTAERFDQRLQRLAAENERRVRLGDLDHLVFYLLQSTRFTTRPPIEPALSARALVEGLGDAGRVSRDVRARAADLLRRIAAPGGDMRLAYFGRLIDETMPDRRNREQQLIAEYRRVMRFVYDKEFGPGRTDAAAAASLYRSRGLSTDTAVEAGFLVTQGLGVMRGLDPTRRVRRVLIVGAGLDLAPRTALLEQAPPQSYQPWAVLDALVGLGLSRLDDVTVVAADINPRVVEHLRARRADPPQLSLLSGIGDDATLTLAADYREYFAALGQHIGRGDASKAQTGRGRGVPRGHLYKRLQVAPAAARVVQAARLDVVTERLRGEPFDLVIATNVLPYFDDEALTLAMANIVAMLSDDGVLMHNEARPALHGIARALGLPSTHSRHAVIAAVAGAPPLGDSVWLHVRAAVRPGEPPAPVRPE